MNHRAAAIALVALVIAWTGTALAGKRCCNRCGCESSVKKVCRLVLTYREVTIPTYQCLPTSTFYPCKGKVCKDGHRYDNFYTLHKNCDGTHNCRCKPSHSRKTLYGGNPLGSMSNCNVRQPTGTSKQRVPVMKWVTVELCKDCCDKCKSRR